MRTLIILLGTGLVCTALVVAPSNATTIERAPPSAYAAATTGSIEVTGVVRAVKPLWEGKRILSHVTLETATGELTTFVVPGGSIDGIAMRVSGMPAFSVGEHARVTLRPIANVRHFVGLEAGKTLLP